MSLIDIIILSLTICIDSSLLCLFITCKKKIKYFLIPLIFSIMQVLFLLIGYSLGAFLENYLLSYLKYIIFIVFSFMGSKLLIDTLKGKDNEDEDKNVNDSLKVIIIQACFTSCDSLFLGLPVAFTNTNYLLFLTIVFSLTFVLCFISLFLRKKINKKYDDTINIIGAIILFFFAFKSLI